MTGLWIALGIVGFFTLILCARIGVQVHFGGTLTVCVGALGKYFQIVPKKRISLKKKKKAKKNKKSKPKPEQTSKPKEDKPKKKKKVNLTAILDLVIAALKGLGRTILKLSKSIHISANVWVELASDDAAKTAETYGKISAALGVVTPELYRIFSVHDCSIRLDADFLDEKTDVRGNVQVTTSLGGILGFAFAFLGSFLKEYLRRRRQHSKPREHGFKTVIGVLKRTGQRIGKLFS